MKPTEIEVNETNYPSVKNAFELALKSYDWAIQRSDVIDNRISKFLAWISSITMGVIAIVFVKSSPIQLNLVFFYPAMIFFVACILIGAFVEFKSWIAVISPVKLHEKYLGYDDFEFKKNLIYWAGQDYEDNRHRINLKGNALATIYVLFLIELLLLGLSIIF